MTFRIQATSLSGDWLFSFHLDHLSSVGRYSWKSRLQKWFIICCRSLHDLKLAGIWLSKFPGGRELNGQLIRKWLGVRGIWLSGRLVIFVRVREFKIASLSISIVWNTSSESFFEPRMISSVVFAVCIKRFQTPPKWGPYGGLKFQVVFVPARAL